MAEGRPFKTIDGVILAFGTFMWAEAIFDITHNDNFLLDVVQIAIGSYLITDRVGKVYGWKWPWD